MNLIDKYSELIEKLSEKKGVLGVYMFGSYAKNKQTKRSDLDICVFIDYDDENLHRDIVSFKNEEIDISVFHKLPLSIQFEILSKGKPIKINDAEKFKEMKLKILHKYKEESHLYKNAYYKRYGIEI